MTALYLNPIFDSPSNHKYDTRDYFKVDAHLGTNAQFAELTRNLHQRGMRIILDAVVNHTSTEHPGSARRWAPEQPGLPWRSFYTFDQEGDYVSWKGSQLCPGWISQVNRCRTPFIGQTTPFCATGCAPPTRSMAGALTSSTCWGAGALPRAIAAMCAPFAAR